MGRPKNGLGLPALTTPEAFVLFVVLTVLFGLFTALVFGHPWSGASIAFALILAAMTPKYRRKGGSG